MIHEENGQIIVDELRPMSDIPDDNEVVLVCVKDDGGFQYFDNMSKDCVEMNLYDGELLGWIPRPIYRPKDGA